MLFFFIRRSTTCQHAHAASGRLLATSDGAPLLQKIVAPKTEKTPWRFFVIVLLKK